VEICKFFENKKNFEKEVPVEEIGKEKIQRRVTKSLKLDPLKQDIRRV
jgi:hypothetical protein